MYVDINTATYDSKANTVVLECTDLDNILLNDWAQEFSDKAQVTFKWDLTQTGHRLYLYKMMRSLVKEDCTSLADMVSALTNKICRISSNFIAQAEG